MKWQRALATILGVVTTSGLAIGCEEEPASITLPSPATAAPDAGRADAGRSDGGNATGMGNVMSDAGRSDGGARDSAASGDGGATTPAADYTKKENWLCRPDNNGACDVDLDTTIVKADGTFQTEKFQKAANPEFDCFYVYPTVSLDTTPNSDLVAGMEENNVVKAQFARFGQHCRLYAPLYRQVTLTYLRASMSGTPPATAPDRALGLNDVLAAWRHYMEKDNKGRGVLLVGHSQGSGVLTELIKREIDPDPTKVPFISAFLIGTNLTVPEGKTVGGAFQKVPVCTETDELGCAVSYVSFRDEAPPPAGALFGSAMTAGQEVACVNPAALGGGPKDLHAYLSTTGPGTSALPMGSWVRDTTKTITTPFVSVPGLITGECKPGTRGSYLSIKINGNPDDPRTDQIVGDVVTNDMVQAGWGLHVIDVHLAMGDLLALAKAKAAAWKAK